MITRDNYEIYFIDYFDGNLTAEETKGLFSFLEENGDLKKEFESFENSVLPSTNEGLPNKEIFKRELFSNETEEEEALIANLEGDLSIKDKEELGIYLRENPAVRKKMNVLYATKLPVVEIKYPFKSELKKKSRVIAPIFYWVSSAAAVAILTWNVLQTNTPEVVNYAKN